MCGRYRRRATPKGFGDLFGVEFSDAGMELEALEIAPGSVQPVIWLDAAGQRRLAPMRWGFQLPDRFLINTRSETAAASRFWQQAWQMRRCLIPADGFYEWASQDGGAKSKYCFTVDDGALLALAGLWSPWRNPKTGREEATFSILTGEARSWMSRYHDRQPGMIEKNNFSAFLSPATAAPASLLEFYGSSRMQATPVAEPRKPRPASAQGSLFAEEEDDA